MSVLGQKHRGTVAALADCFFPSLGPGDPPGSAIVPDALADLMEDMEASGAKQLTTLLALFESAAWLSHRKPFSRLGPRQRERYVNSWLTSRLPVRRTAYKALRDLLGNLYYADERTWPTLGYPGPPVDVDARSKAGQ